MRYIIPVLGWDKPAFAYAFCCSSNYRESTGGWNRSVRNPALNSEHLKAPNLVFQVLMLPFFSCQMPPSFAFTACHMWLSLYINDSII